VYSNDCNILATHHLLYDKKARRFPGLVFLLVVFILQEDHLYFARAGQEQEGQELR
jgi:hypothetical protein